MLKSIGKGIVLVIDGLARCCAVLLLRLGLWVPSVYSLIFLAVRVGLGAGFNGIIRVAFFIGLGISVMAGISFALFMRKRAKNKKVGVLPVKDIGGAPQRAAFGTGKNSKNANNNLSEKKVKKDKKSGRGGSTTIANRHPAFREEYVIPDEKYVQNSSERKIYDGRETEYESRFVKSAESDFSEVQIRNPGSALKEEIKNAKPSEYQYPKNGLGAETLWDRLEGASRPSEQPMIFATRSDPNVFVYEYSDRIQYWRRAAKGMTLLGTEFKENHESRESKPKAKV